MWGEKRGRNRDEELKVREKERGGESAPGDEFSCSGRVRDKQESWFWVEGSREREENEWRERERAERLCPV